MHRRGPIFAPSGPACSPLPSPRAAPLLRSWKTKRHTLPRESTSGSMPPPTAFVHYFSPCFSFSLFFLLFVKLIIFEFTEFFPSARIKHRTLGRDDIAASGAGQLLSSVHDISFCNNGFKLPIPDKFTAIIEGQRSFTARHVFFPFPFILFLTIRFRHV